MGIAGAALASSVAEAIAFFCYLIYTLKFVDLKKYGFHDLSTFFRFDILKNVFTISFWMMLQPFMSIGVWFFFFIAVERLGERSLAVINIVRSCSALPFIIIHAFATATASLVSNLIGENKTEQVWRLLNKILISAFLFVIPILIFYAVFPKLCLRIYTDNPGLIDASVNAIYIMCISTFIQIGAFIFFNAVSGTGAVKATVLIETVNLAIYILFVWLVIIRRKPSPAVAWSAEISYQSITLLFCLLFLLFGKWRNKKI
jgi:Na+-driven multidrug efflux pump